MYIYDYMLNDKNFHARVEAGKSIEAQIVRTLNDKYNINIVPADAHDDMVNKIDAWITDSAGQKKSVQIKFREDDKKDIIFEVVKDLDRNILGRDLVGKSDYYLVVDSFGDGTMVATAPIKAIAEQVRKALMPVFHKKSIWGGKGYEIHITIDKSSGNRKMMMFISPSILKAEAKYKFDIR